MRGGGLVRLGFVGVGKMGSHMASNLLRAGYKLFICDSNKEATTALQKQGAQIAESPAELGAITGISFFHRSRSLQPVLSLPIKLNHHICNQSTQVCELYSACFLVHITLKTPTSVPMGSYHQTPVHFKHHFWLTHPQLTQALPEKLQRLQVVFCCIQTLQMPFLGAIHR